VGKFLQILNTVLKNTKCPQIIFPKYTNNLFFTYFLQKLKAIHTTKLHKAKDTITK